MKPTPKPRSTYFVRCVRYAVISLAMLVLLLAGPAADTLQAKRHTASPAQSWDAVYLVCGARAQPRRLHTLTQWMEHTPPPAPLILVGNDDQISLWSRPQQRNLTRAEWGILALEDWRSNHINSYHVAPEIRLVPGAFDNTDGEMQALADTLRHSPEIRRIAIVTSRFHARRALCRLRTYAPPGLTIAVVPGRPHWEDRAPWIVAGEYLKLLRDALGYTRTPFITRRPAPGSHR